MTVEHPRRKLDEIQLLRAVAALAVVGQHLPLVRVGAFGVDLFFVISGFIMCFVTEAPDRFFVRKRVIRIVPLYWALTIGLFVVGRALPSLEARLGATFGELAMSLAFIPFPRDDSIHPIVFLGWSLNVEVFFYALFALAMRVSHTHRVLVASALLCALVVVGRVADFDAVAARFYTTPLFLEFAFGMGLYAATRRARARPEDSPPWCVALSLVTMALLVALMAASTVMGRTLPRVVEWGIPSALIMLIALIGLRGARLPRLVTQIGDASFSLYLFHPYVIELVERALARSGVSPDGVFAAVAATAASIVVALLSFRLIERPLTDLLRRRLVATTSGASPPSNARAARER